MNYKLHEAVERIESVSVCAQKDLHDIILETTFRKNPVACYRGHDQEIAELEASGLCIRVDAPEAAIRFIGRNELVKRLSAAGVSGFKKNSSLDAIVKWSMESAGEAVLTLTPDISTVVTAPALDRIRRKVYTYLNRKFFDESYFDPDTGNVIDYPHGASFVATVDMGGNRGVLRCEFPDDEITELLDKYGCNRCKMWKKPEA